MAEDRVDLPEDAIREALDRLTVAVITLAVETARASKASPGDPQTAIASVMNVLDHVQSTLNQMR